MKIINSAGFFILMGFVIFIIAFVHISGCSAPSTQPLPQTPAITALPSPATPQPSTTIIPVTTAGTCRQGLTWCSDHCSDLSVAIGDCGTCGATCLSGQSCIKGQCCKKGLIVCNGTCTSLEYDGENCGICGNACPDGYICHEWKCVNRNIECPESKTLCLDEKCYDLTTDNMNCGSCGNVCPPFSGCTNGVCVDMEGDFVYRESIIINMPV